MRLLNTIFILAMILIFGYVWVIQNNDLASLPFLGLAILGAINELDYRLDDIKKNLNLKE